MVMSYLAYVRSQDWEVYWPHWVWKNPSAYSTAVRNFGQWPNGWTSNLQEWELI